MNWLYKITQWFSRIMYGRYGSDQLSIALMIAYVLFILIGEIFDLPILLILSYILVLYGFFRMFSKNIAARRKENEKFLKIYNPVKKYVKDFIFRFKQRKQYRFFRCPTCKTMTRVPRLGKKIEITCPHCGNKFTKKT